MTANTLLLYFCLIDQYYTFMIKHRKPLPFAFFCKKTTKTFAFENELLHKTDQ